MRQSMDSAHYRALKNILWVLPGEPARLPTIEVDGYITAVCAFAGIIGDGVEVSLIERNPFETSHQEFVPEFLRTKPTEIDQSVLARFPVSF